MVIFLIAVMVLLGACGGEPRPTLTDEVTRVASHVRASMPESRNPSVPAQRRALLDEGWGDETEAAGEAWVDVGEAHPGSSSKRVARWVHLADVQLADDESPGRVSATDAPGATKAAFRPHDAWLCAMTDAMVGQVRALKPDFVLLGGDNIDNAQSNELDWFLTLMNGGPLECDSGKDDPGEPKEPFEAKGLGGIPFVWVTGNHDVLLQGNFVPTDEARAAVVGSRADLGTRDWSKAGGPVVQGEVSADSRRALVSAVELHRRAFGLAQERANHTWDLEGTVVRVVALDTAARSGGSDGVLLRADFEGFLKPALDAARDEGKWVVLASHHASTALGDGAQQFGTRQPDAVPAAEYVALITSYPNVLIDLVAHNHRHRVRVLAGEHPLVEMTTASLADWPFQARLLELFDEGNGWLRIRATSIDVPATTELLQEARRLGVLDWTTRWYDTSPSAAADRNVDVWVAKP